MPQTYPMTWNTLIIMTIMNMKNISMFLFENPMKFKKMNNMKLKINNWSW